MKTEFDDEDRKKIEEAVRDLWEDLPDEFKNEYQVDYLDAKKRMILRWESMSPWDKLLPLKDRIRTKRLKIDFRVKCPNLRKAVGSKALFYCRKQADEKFRGGFNYAKEIDANEMSAQYQSHCKPGRLRIRCCGDYTLCKFFNKEKFE